jgi:hypothetical protein
MQSNADSTGFLYSLLLSRPMPRPDQFDDGRSRGTRELPRRRGWFGDSEAAIETTRHRIDEISDSRNRGAR